MVKIFAPEVPILGIFSPESSKKLRFGFADLISMAKMLSPNSKEVKSSACTYYFIANDT